MDKAIVYIRKTLGSDYPPGEIRSLTRLIMERVCSVPPYRLLLDKDRKLSGSERRQIAEIVERLLRREPVQYIMGEAWFYGLRFEVNPSTLIPRPETEELVELILTGCRGRHSLSLLDIGTGSGCIACTLAKLLPGLQATGMDISGEALETARRNARSLALDTVAFIQADILSNVEAERKITESFDLIVANPPYVLESEKAAMESNVLNYEPHIALFVPGGDPLVFHRRIARFGRRRLKPGGELYMEINALLGNETVELLRREGYAPVELLTDISGKDRIVKARLL